MKKMDAMDTLGVEEDATPEDIKRAFRAASRKAHPDAGGSEEDFCRVNAAYRLLTGKEKTSRVAQEQEAVTVALGAFFEKLDESLTFKRDPIKRALDVLKGREKEAGSEIGLLEKKRDRLERARKNIKRKKGEPLFEDAMNRAKVGIDEAIDERKQKASIIRKAQAMLKELEWTGEKEGGVTDSWGIASLMMGTASGASFTGTMSS